MAESQENMQVQQFASKLAEFGKNLKDATTTNTMIVKTIDKETSELRTTALNLIKLVSETIATLKQSVKASEKAGVASGPLKEQIAKLEEILRGLNAEVGNIKISNETGQNIRSNLEDIKSSLEQQEKILKDSGSPGEGPSGTILSRLFTTGDTGDEGIAGTTEDEGTAETRFNGGKRRRHRRTAHKTNRRKKSHNKHKVRKTLKRKRMNRRK